MSTIGIVDDNIDIREGLKQILSLFDDLEVIYEARDGQEAVDHVKNGKNCPALFLMDVEMHHMDGLEATRIIKELKPAVKILILSVTESRKNLERALANGADGYLVKGEKPLKMVELIRDTLEGRMVMSPQMAVQAMQMLRDSQKVKKEPESYGLTAREMDVLRQLSAGKNHQQISEELFIAPKTVRNHTENIYRKLNVHSRVEASRIAIENEWLWPIDLPNFKPSMRDLFKNYFILFNLLFCFSIGVKAQDSLIIYAREQGLDSMLAYQLATQVPHVAYSEPERGRERAEEALELAQNLNSFYLKGSAYNGWGIYYDITGKLDSAVVAYNAAIVNLKKYRGNQKGVLGGPYNNLGLIYYQIGDFEKALQNFLSAKEQFEESEIVIYTANALGNIALIYQDQGDYEEAMKIQRKVLEIRKNTDDLYGIGASYVNIASLYNLTGENQDSCYYYFQEAIKLKESLPDYRGLAIIYNNLGSIALSRNLEESESNYLEALAYLRKVDDNSLSIGNYRGLAKVNARLGRLEKAQLYIDSAITFATNIEADQELAKNYMVQIHIDSLKQDEPALLQHWPLAYRWNNKVQEENFSEELAMARSRFETSQREEELLQSRAQLAETAAEVARKEVRLKSRQNWIIGLVSLLLLVLIAVFFFRRQQRLKEKQLTAEADLREARAREEAQRALDKERKRIGRELHDNVGGKIYTIVNSLDYLGLKHQDLQEQGELDLLSEQARVVLADLRETIWVMSEEFISVNDFPEKLKEFMAKYETAYTGTCRVEVSGNDNQQLGPEKALAIFRVCQEAFQNAVKYAGCDHFVIQLMVAENTLQLRIEDDGKGFDTTLSRSGSYGLKNMKERIAENNGQFSLHSQPGKGTVIEILLPLQGPYSVEHSA